LKNEIQAKEHIIPQCMGSKLWSKNLICKKCNSEFGTEIDEELIKRFPLIMYPLSLYNKSIKLKDLEVEYGGIKYLFTNNGIKLKDPRPIYDEEGKLKDMIYPNKSKLRKDLRKKKKSTPSIDIQAIIDQSKTVKKDISGPFKFKIEEINEKAYRCCGKICYEFLYIFNEDYRPSDNNFINFVKGFLKIEDYPICVWFPDYIPFNKNEEKIYNIIVVEGKKEEKIIITYLEVYGCLKILMIIDKNYEGESFCDGYYQDLMENRGKFFTPISKISLSRKEVINLIDDCDTVKYKEEILKSILHAGDIARIYPIKKKLCNLYEDISLMENPRTIENLKVILETLTQVSEKYGIYGFINPLIKNVNESFEDVSLLEKITIHLDFLMKYFRGAELKFDIIEKIVIKI